MHRIGIGLLASVLALAPTTSMAGTKVGLNVLLNTDVTDDILTEFDAYGKVRDVLIEVSAVTLSADLEEIDQIAALPYVEAVSPDAERSGVPIDTVWASDFIDGLSTWNLDAIDVTDFGWNNRQVAQDGTGVYVAVLDTGLLYSWRQYFPEERVATEYACAFGGGGGDNGTVSTQPDKWEKDTNSHGTHVTSTILGYDFYGDPINGVAPMATIIPVKVLGQSGSGWSSVIARGIMYVAELKENQLADYPVVINMSLGGPGFDALEQAAIDYAIDKGVIIVASAGNRGTAGMGYPGAYAPVISVAASGWKGEWTSGGWWYQNVADPTDPDHFYIADFSSRERYGQDLDVVAPGAWVVGPYQLQQGKTSYYYLSGTSMASPHVAGIVALMAQKDPSVTADEAEYILESTAIEMPDGCWWGCWGANATGAGLADAAAALDAIP